MFNNKSPMLVLATLVSALLAMPVMASGSSGGGGGGGGASGGGNFGTPTPRVVDEVYEFGKAIYLGRTPGSKRVKYCLKVDGKAKKIGSRSLKSWRGRKQVDFANALYNCKQPDKLALQGVAKEEIAYVMYYLNKRYKLALGGARS